MPMLQQPQAAAQLAGALSKKKQKNADFWKQRGLPEHCASQEGKFFSSEIYLKALDGWNCELSTLDFKKHASYRVAFSTQGYIRVCLRTCMLLSGLM